MSDDVFWSVVKTNVAPDGAEREDEFNEWWDDHAAEYVAKEGFSFGWRLRALDHEAAIGQPSHRYLAVYEVDSVAAFNRALAEGTHSHPGDPWGPWQAYVDRYLLDWERTYYRLLGQAGTDVSQEGSYWAIVMVDLDDHGGARDAEFNRWYNEVHLPEICGYPGVLRGWRFRVEPDDNDLGPRRQRYWAVYELEDPGHFAAAREDRSNRGIEPWDGLWLPHIDNFQISFYEVLMRVDHRRAVALHADT